MKDEMPDFTLLRGSPSRRLQRVFLGIITFVVIGMFLGFSFHSGQPHTSRVTNPGIPRPPPKAFVVASQKKDNTSWLGEYFPDWEANIFVVDDPRAQLKVPKNKGREAMVYLTYIIESYENLPDIMVFMHGERYQWHNDDPIYDGVPLLQDLKLPYIVSEGYVNLRCVWNLGCPAEMKFSEPGSVDPSKTTEIAYPKAFQELFPGLPLPLSVGVACCAQFAATRETIHSRSLEDYRRWRQWLLDTSLEDHISGRVLEYSWHMIFGKPSVHCPNAKDCYCKTYGLCNLECEESKCGERWPFPPAATLPKGWPVLDWDGNSRDQETIDSFRSVAISSTSLPA